MASSPASGSLKRGCKRPTRAAIAVIASSERLILLSRRAMSAGLALVERPTRIFSSASLAVSAAGTLHSYWPRRTAILIFSKSAAIGKRSICPKIKRLVWFECHVLAAAQLTGRGTFEQARDLIVGFARACKDEGAHRTEIDTPGSSLNISWSQKHSVVECQQHVHAVWIELVIERWVLTVGTSLALPDFMACRAAAKNLSSLRQAA